MPYSKIKTLPELQGILKKTRAGKRRLVFTNGCFDLLHAGHVDYLARARALGDILVVGLNSDRSVRRLKGARRPLVGQKNRAKVLSALEAVDFVVIFGNISPLRLIKALRPDILVKGADWKIKDIVGGEFVKSYGGRVSRLPYIKGLSTRGLIRKIKSL